MIRFDRIKLKTKASYITWLNPNFVEETKPHTIKLYSPFLIYIQLRPRRGEAIIEFTSKVLLDEYPKLITHETISKCFENLCDMGYCSLDSNSIINDSDLMSADITQDIDGISLPQDFSLMLISNLKRISDYTVVKYQNSGYTIINHLKTPHLKIRLSIYDKYKELQKSPNKSFLNMLSDPNALMDFYRNMYRVETNMKTQAQLRCYCEVNDNKLISFLTSKANPLMKLFNTVFANDTNESDHVISNNTSILDYESINQLRDALILKECGNNLKMVGYVLKNYYSPNTNTRKYMCGYKKLLAASPKQSQNKLMIGQIRDKLSA